jgi:hypothetical protein
VSLTVTCKRLPTEEPGSSDQNQQRNYSISYLIEQTDTGTLATPKAMITAAQALGANPLPLYGDTYVDDADAYAMQFNWRRPSPAEFPKRLEVTIGWLPPKSIDPGRLAEPDPLAWPTEYWVEWTEEQVVLEEATNVEELQNIDRPALTLGKVVNACGVEFTEPLMKTVYYPVLHCQKAYEFLEDIVSLNVSYQNTTNSGTFFGALARTAKYLGTESGRIQKINGQSLYMGITRIWFKNATWDRKVLNNGWSHFKLAEDTYPIANEDGKGVLFKNKVNDNPPATGDPAGDPDTPCSEPLNLSLLGELLAPDDPPVFITYRDLDEVDYLGIGIGG